MQQKLRVCIDRVRAIVISCKIHNGEDMDFQTNAGGQLIYPDFNNEVNYSDQSNNLNIKNQLSSLQIKEMSEQTFQLKSEVQKLERMWDQYCQLFEQPKKYRWSVYIDKQYACPYDGCNKKYGSDVAVNLHIKLKHNGGIKSERQKLAKQICRAQLRALPFPQIQLNFPPGYIQQFRKSFVDNEDDIRKQQSR